MNEKELMGYDIPDDEEIATLENLTRLAGNLLDMNDIKGEQWQELRDGLYKYITNALNYRKAEGQSPTVGDVSSELWAYSRGYTDAHNVFRHRCEAANQAHIQPR